MLVIRSLIFNFLFYVNLLVQVVAALPTLLMPRRAIIAVARFWARTNLWLLRVVCGIEAEFRGLEKIPPGPSLVSWISSRVGHDNGRQVAVRTGTRLMLIS